MAEPREPIHLLFGDFNYACGGQGGRKTSFIDIVTCERCLSWHKTNKWALQFTPQFNETLVLTDEELAECAVCPAQDDPRNMTRFGEGDDAVYVCYIHVDSYRRELERERPDNQEDICD